MLKDVGMEVLETAATSMESMVVTTPCGMSIYLRDEQLRVVTTFVRGSDVLAVLPTGYGKSLLCSPTWCIGQTVEDK